MRSALSSRLGKSALTPSSETPATPERLAVEGEMDYSIEKKHYNGLQRRCSSVKQCFRATLLVVLLMPVSALASKYPPFDFGGHSKNLRADPRAAEREHLHRMLEGRRSVRRSVHEVEQSGSRYQLGFVDTSKFDLVKYPSSHPMMEWARHYQRRLSHWKDQHEFEEDAHKAYWNEFQSWKDKAKLGEEEASWTTGKGRVPEHYGFDVQHQQEHEKDQDEEHKRNLQESLFQPMRICYYTEALENASAEAEKKAIVLEEILPRAREFWEQALSVVPVDGPLKMDTNELVGNGRFCGDSEFTEVPASHSQDGVDNCDLLLYVSAKPSDRFCGANTLAVAVSCNHDAFDRPVAGAINICLDAIELEEDGTMDPAVIDDNVDVIIHEIGHVLAMSSNHFTHFRYSNGTPRTSRNFQQQTVTCVQGDERAVIMPSPETLGFFEDKQGSRYAALVTEKVQQVARNHFDCQTIPGAKLENQPTGASCFGDHWDEKFGYSSTMSGVIAPTENYLTPLTLALAEDTGWYSANYSLSRVSPWGHAAGCDFFDSPCLSADADGVTSVPDYGRGFFCARGSERGCSPAHTHKMACTVIDWDLYFPAIPPPEKFQYFLGEPGKGGPKQADYCPVYGSTYRDLSARELDCRDENNVDFVNFFDEYYGEDSMCVESSTESGRCFKGKCILDERVLRLQLNGVWYTCEEDFQELPLTTTAGTLISGTITCPRLAQACPDLFCPVNCAGRGICDFTNEQDGKIVPKCNCFDTSDTSPGCSASLILSGKYIEDGSELVDIVTESFFDPLVAVFTDHPDTWETESWGWASGLFVIFLLMLLCICSSFWPKKKVKTIRRYG